MNDLMVSIVRALVKGAAAIAVAHGIFQATAVNEKTIEIVTGVIVFIVGQVWSYVHAQAMKRKAFTAGALVASNPPPNTVIEVKTPVVYNQAPDTKTEQVVVSEPSPPAPVVPVPPAPVVVPETK